MFELVMLLGVIALVRWGFTTAIHKLWMRLFGEPLHGGADIRQGEGVLSRVATTASGFASPIGNPSEHLATIFAFGRRDPRQHGQETVFEAPAGWRFGFLAVAGFLGFFAVHFETSGQGGEPQLDMYVFLGALLLYMGAYIWSFRLSIDGVRLTCMNYLFQTRSYDLTQLVAARRGKDGYKLHFADGRKANVPLFIEGHDILIQFLGEELEANGY